MSSIRSYALRRYGRDLRRSAIRFLLGGAGVAIITIVLRAWLS